VNITTIKTSLVPDTVDNRAAASASPLVIEVRFAGCPQAECASGVMHPQGFQSK
jgi:hypothetical protein